MEGKIEKTQVSCDGMVLNTTYLQGWGRRIFWKQKFQNNEFLQQSTTLLIN